MANGHGGHRKPSNPAPASGPGRLSRRTDGGPGQKLMVPDGQPYGDRQGLLDQEKTAALAQVDSIPTPQISAPPAPAGQGYTGPGMGDPTTRPNEPITTGVDIGAGAGPEALTLPAAQQPSGFVTQTLAQLAPTDTTGTLAKLYLIAKQRGV